MAGRALGIIETVGLASAIEAADSAAKAANVELIGYELSRGGGYITVKLEGDVGAVQAAVDAGVAAASQVNRVVSSHVIPRPHQDTGKMVFSRETVGHNPPAEEKSKEAPEKVPEKVPEEALEVVPKEALKEAPLERIEKPKETKKPVASPRKKTTKNLPEVKKQPKEHEEPKNNE